MLPAYNQPVMGPAHLLNSCRRSGKVPPCASQRVAHYHSERIEEWMVSDEKRFDMNVKEHSENIREPTGPHPLQRSFERAPGIINLRVLHCYPPRVASFIFENG